MAEFRRPSPNVIVSDDGTIRTTGRAGVDVTYRGEHVRVSSEMLDPPMSIALFVSGSDAPATTRADEVVAFVVEGLESAGFAVEVR